MADLADYELFDASDVIFEIVKSKNVRQVTLIAKSQTPFNLMKLYLALKDYVEQIETEIGVMEAAPEVQ